MKYLNMLKTVNFLQGLIKSANFILALAFLASSSQFVSAQNISGIVNSYAVINNIDACSGIIQVNNVSGFNIGDKVLIIQTKGADIDLTNSINFGEILNYNSAGLFEFGRIAAINGNTINLNFSLVNTYNVANGVVQIITVPEYTDANVTATLTGKVWDGTSGGVIAIDVSNTLTLNADIDASNIGFRAGDPSLDYFNGCSGENDFFYPFPSNFGGEKGEGVVDYVAAYRSGRGHLANGGGGGGVANAGGGGGGNYGSGGRGGDSFECNANPWGGEPGSALDYTANNRLFMGGSGGGGQQNNSNGIGGANGAGIIIIIANAITSSGFGIKADGQDAQTAGNDGGGGGGAGGAILLDIQNYMTNIMVSADGGKGGDMTKSTCHGPGGGGGGGIVALTGPTTPAQLQVSYNGGVAGIASCNGTPYGAAAGTAGATVQNFILPESNILSNTISVGFTSTDTCQFISFVDTSNVINSLSSWDFGDNNTGVGQFIKHSYINAGVYNVKLIVDNGFGCKDSITKVVQAFESFKAGFEVMNDCSEELAQFTDTSSGNMLNYNWDFGVSGINTDISNLQNPTYQYTEWGDYNVRLIAIDDKGCADTVNQLVTRFPHPEVNFSPDTVCLNDSTQFTDLSSIATGNITQWEWAFGDPIDPISNLQNPKHLYTLGSYPVTLKVISDQGCEGSKVKTVSVHPLPVADFNTTNACVNAQPIVFTDESNINSGNISTWDWNFGDMQFSNSNAPVNNYASAGNYDVTLIVSSQFGCKDTIVKAVTVYPSPSAKFTADLTTGCEKLCVNFMNQSDISSGNIDIYNWKIDGSTVNIENPEYCFDKGLYDIRLEVISDQNCSNTLLLENYIDVIEAPIADFTYTPTSVTSQNPLVKFNNISLNEFTSSWQFGDSESSTEFSPGHLYKDTGDYTVRLIVTSNNGCIDTLEQNLQIEVTPTLFFPNAFSPNGVDAFSPNGDGINDYFQPIGEGLEGLELEILIFDRWGNVIFKSNNAGIGWDGLVGKKPAREGVYVYKASLRRGTEILKSTIGSVTLVR